MHQVGHVGVVTLLGTLLALLWGCSGGPPAPPSGPELYQNVALQEVGDLYRSSILDTKKPPTKVADLARYEIGLPSGYRELKSGNIVVLWGAPLSDSATNTVLAYETSTPKSGGFVLMQDGKTIKKMSVTEFQSAPKAGGTTQAKSP